MRAWIIFGILIFIVLRAVAFFVIPPIGDEMMQLYVGYDIAHFLNFPIYLYQQQHMGPIESYLAAPFIRLWGPSLWLGRIFANLFYLSFMGLFLWTVRRLFGRPFATYAFVLLAAVPFPVLFLTTMFGHDEVLLLAALALIFLLRIAGGRGSGFWNSLLLGLISGLAFWCNAIFGVWLAAIVIILACMIPMSWKKRIPFSFALGLLMGMTPLWIHALKTGTLMGLSGAGGSFAEPRDLPRLLYLFFARMKYFLISFPPGSNSPAIDHLIRYLTLVPFLVFSFSFAALGFFFLRPQKESGGEGRVFQAFILIPPFALALLYLSRSLLEDEGMRFFLPLLVSYAFVVPWWLLQIQNVFWRRGILVALLAISLAGFPFSARYEFQKTSEFRDLTWFLEAEGLEKGIAEFGVAYSLNVASNGQLLVTPPWYVAAYRPILKQVRDSGPQFFILGRLTQRFRRKLESDPRLKKAVVSHYDVFYGDSPLLKQFTTPGELMEE